jgi:AhpD family alkylhydroperoxidase
VSTVKEFVRERDRLNKLVMKHASLKMKKFYSLDAQAYLGGAIPKKYKELLGLVASFVLRCNDCIDYHLMRCRDEGVTDQELEEVLNVGLVVGGSITIPHLRRAFDRWLELKRISKRK